MSVAPCKRSNGFSKIGSTIDRRFTEALAPRFIGSFDTEAAFLQSQPCRGVRLPRTIFGSVKSRRREIQLKLPRALLQQVDVEMSPAPPRRDQTINAQQSAN
jgi:hypothetical protein